MKVLKNYLSTILLLLGLVVGAILGIAAPKLALQLKPFGDLFINLIFMFIVPFIFFSIAGSIANVGKLKRIGKIMLCSLGVFLLTSIIAVVLGILFHMVFKPLSQEDIKAISQTIVQDSSSEQTEAVDKTDADQTMQTTSGLERIGKICGINYHK